MSIISYPTPLYQNVAIQTGFYAPQRFNISAISTGQTTTVTTSVDHDYVVGQQVRLIIPPDYGSRQLNNKLAYVLSIPTSTQVLLDITSLDVDAFTNPGTGAGAQILTVGDVNSGEISSTGNTSLTNKILGSFVNTST